jgi:hypothetical protein
MIQRCTDSDIAAIDTIVNEAAQAYRGIIPADCWHEPYMTRSNLMAEIALGVNFWGWNESDVLIGIMGLQNVRDVTLIRHGYVRPLIRAEALAARYSLLSQAKPRGRCWSVPGPPRCGPSAFTSDMAFAWSPPTRRNDFLKLTGTFLCASKKPP